MTFLLKLKFNLIFSPLLALSLSVIEAINLLLEDFLVTHDGVEEALHSWVFKQFIRLLICKIVVNIVIDRCLKFINLFLKLPFPLSFDKFYPPVLLLKVLLIRVKATFFN